MIPSVEQPMRIVYTNWRGETAERSIVPMEIHFGSTKWHLEAQWLLTAYDLDRQAERQFAIRDIKSWAGEQEGIISHQSESLELEKIRYKIREQGDLPYATVAAQEEMLDQLAAFPFGRWILTARGLNGYWTDYLVMHTQRGDASKELSQMEDFVLNRAPLSLATQERFHHFQAVIQNHLRDGLVIGSLPCGLMGDLLTMDYDDFKDVTLMGLDLDIESLLLAAQRAEEMGLAECTTLRVCDAWQIEQKEQFDLLVSHGLNIYVANRPQELALYQQLWKALKPGGSLLTSFFTYPPTAMGVSEWRMDQIAFDDLLKQKLLTVDIGNMQFNHFHSSDEMQQLLQEAGFEQVVFHYDRAQVCPTVVARKP